MEIRLQNLGITAKAGILDLSGSSEKDAEEPFLCRLSERGARLLCKTST